MKKISVIIALLFIGSTLSLKAQSKVSHAGHEVKKGAKKVGNKTAELASKGKSKIVNKSVKDKTGPNNETIYMDNQARYYWIDKKGHNHYIPASALKNKM